MADFKNRSVESMSGIEKTGTTQHEVIHDSDLVRGDSREQAMSHLTEEEVVDDKRLRRKIDSIIMPMVVLVYLMNYIDRNNYPAAKLAGLVDDLNMTGNQFQVGLSELFVGYVLMWWTTSI